jgi:hypothetical protein
VFSLEIPFKSKIGTVALGPGPAPSFPLPAHALTCSPCAPPAPLLPHSARHRLTNAHLRRSRSTARMSGPVLLLLPRGAARTRPPLLHPFLQAALQSRHPPLVFFGAKVTACPLSPIYSSARESGCLKPPTPPPCSFAAKCPLPGVGFRRPSPEIAEKPLLPPHLFGELRYSPSPSQNGCTSSCSLSLSLVPRNPVAPPLAAGRHHCRQKPTVLPLLHHLNGAVPPQ